MQFTSQILVERTRPNERATVKEQGNKNENRADIFKLD